MKHQKLSENNGAAAGGCKLFHGVKTGITFGGESKAEVITTGTPES